MFSRHNIALVLVIGFSGADDAIWPLVFSRLASENDHAIRTHISPRLTRVIRRTPEVYATLPPPSPRPSLDMDGRLYGETRSAPHRTCLSTALLFIILKTVVSSPASILFLPRKHKYLPRSPASEVVHRRFKESEHAGMVGRMGRSPDGARRRAFPCLPVDFPTFGDDAFCVHLGSAVLHVRAVCGGGVHRPRGEPRTSRQALWNAYTTLGVRFAGRVLRRSRLRLKPSRLGNGEPQHTDRLQANTGYG